MPAAGVNISKAGLGSSAVASLGVSAHRKWRRRLKAAQLAARRACARHRRRKAHGAEEYSVSARRQPAAGAKTAAAENWRLINAMRRNDNAIINGQSLAVRLCSLSKSAQLVAAEAAKIGCRIDVSVAGQRKQ